MQQSMDRFCEALSAEREVHRELLRLSARKRDAITSNDVSSLDKIVKNEETLLSRLGHWEKVRKACVVDLAKEVGRPAGEIVLKDFFEFCTERQKEQLSDLHTELGALLEKQITINEINKRLIESRLEYINFSLETAVGGGQAAYHNYGDGQNAVRPPSKTRIIDQKI
ncbi:MAG: flagellar protein FlgN [Oscillospiraceae bacterium]|nr:flagellar protein FlgN [Oscillospiraceae bacterium]